MDAQALATPSGFWEWFNAERNARRLSLRAIELSGTGTATGWLRKRMVSGLPPTYEGCRIIAAALGIPVDEVLRHAGLLPEGAELPEIEELGGIARGLTHANLKTLLSVARALAATERQLSEPASYRVIGLSRKPWSRRDWRLAVESLTPEERAGLLRELAAEGFPVRDVTRDEPEPEESGEPGEPGESGEAGP